MLVDHFWNIGSRENKVLKLVRVIYLLWIYEVLKSYIYFWGLILEKINVKV